MSDGEPLNCAKCHAKLPRNVVVSWGNPGGRKSPLRGQVPDHFLIPDPEVRIGYRCRVCGYEYEGALPPGKTLPGD